MGIFNKKEKEVPEFTEVQNGDGQVIDTIVEYPFRDPIVTATGSWKKRKAEIEFWLAKQGLVYPIDEVALMFDDKAKLFEFIDAAVREPGVKLFNAATDHVLTSPVLGEYWVSYYFLEVEDLGMRVEVMYIERGRSPLHDSLKSYGNNPTIDFRSHDDPVVVHFSYKVAKSDYLEARAAMVGGGATLVQDCQSTYGRFSYYRHPEIGENIYIKPRVNMRDVEPEVDTPLPNTTGSDRGDFGFPGIGGTTARKIFGEM